MKFKTIGLAVSLAFVLGVTPATAQEAAEANLEVLANAIQANADAIIAVNLDLTDEEAKGFWPAYEKYQGEMAGVRSRFLELMRDYITNYDTMDDAHAQQLLAESLSIEKDRVGIRQKHMKSFGEVLPGRKLARFYQIENKMRAVVRYELASEIPVLATTSQ